MVLGCAAVSRYGIQEPCPYDSHMRQLLYVLLATSLLLTACGGEASSTVVRPFTDIQAGEISLQFDPSGTGAVLQVGTSIDVVCAVAFGRTEELGQLSTDDDMAGGAHDDHSPRLRDLEPDTNYFYRLQGVGPNGELYQSDLMTFRTPLPAETGLGDNLAPSAASVMASSEFSASFAAANAVDGDLGTEWSSRGDGDDAWIQIDMGREVTVEAVAFMTRSMGDGSSSTQGFTITVDGGAPSGPYSAFELLTPIDVDLTGQVFRFDVDTSTGGNTGAVEVAVYGTG